MLLLTISCVCWLESRPLHHQHRDTTLDGECSQSQGLSSGSALQLLSSLLAQHLFNRLEPKRYLQPPSNANISNIGRPTGSMSLYLIVPQRGTSECPTAGHYLPLRVPSEWIQVGCMSKAHLDIGPNKSVPLLSVPR